MINKLVDKIKKTNAPVVVGLDPMMSYIPEHITKKAFDEFGETLEGAAEAIWQYNKGIIDTTYDLIPAVKPQIAMYEQFGVPGLVAFDKTVKYAKEKDLVVIGDVKRGDIGSTSAAYATGHLGKVQVGSKKYSLFDEDFATVNPYLPAAGRYLASMRAVKPDSVILTQYNHQHLQFHTPSAHLPDLGNPSERYPQADTSLFHLLPDNLSEVSLHFLKGHSSVHS